MVWEARNFTPDGKTLSSIGMVVFGAGFGSKNSPVTPARFLIILNRLPISQTLWP